MKKLYLSILWHQHQPYYKDDGDGRYHLPWVYLHALKDYYEMACHVENSSNVKVVFNYVPSLLTQLEDYTDPEVADSFLMLLRRDPNTLSADERASVAEQCFMANADNMIKPIKRYAELHEKYTIGGWQAFDDKELLDLEILYILAWCGKYLFKKDPHLKYLLEKGRNYTADDKSELLLRAAAWVSNIKEIHKKLKYEGKAEISCTPYYHPILPLLTDFNSAKEAYPEIPMPEFTVTLEKDADWHVSEGLKKFESFFGFRPDGMWPAEGSVSQRTAAKYAANGIRWIATDEEVLGNSLKKNLHDGANRQRLYMKHFQVHEGRKINIFFRDKALSDLIGFTYSSWNADDAVNDFMKHLRGIYDSVGFSPHVSVILDGENAWEYYKDNAFDFFTKLYARLGSADWLQMQTFSEAVSNVDVPEELVSNITAGSWIMGNFRIWIGHPEKNKAWELLSKTKRTIDQNIGAVTKDVADQIYKELHIAEGSDWFWWFGDDHFSAQSATFDRLFRNHLVNIHRLLKINVPAELYLPIKTSGRTGLVRRQSCTLTPFVDGRFTSFYEWLGAGEYDLKADAGAMHAGGSELKTLFFAFDETKIYLALDSDFREGAGEKVLEIELLSGSDRHVYTAKLSQEQCHGDNIDYAVGRIFEAALDITALRASGGDKVYIVLRMKSDGKIIEKAPLYTAVEVDISNDFSDEWMV